MTIKNRKKNKERIKNKIPEYNANDYPPLFSFTNICSKKKFSYESLNDLHKTALINTIYQLSQIKWAKLIQTEKHGTGCEKIDKSCIDTTILNKVPEECVVLAFRFYSMAAMLGYRGINGAFHIIAFDTKFKAYNH